jgi:hypothetical protein
MKAVDRLGGDAQGGVETEGGVGAPDVIVDRLGKSEHGDPGVVESKGVLHGPPTAQTHQGGEVVLVDDLRDHRAHVHRPSVADVDLVHLDPAGTQNGAAAGEDPREGVAVEAFVAVLHEPGKTIAEADDVHAVAALGSLAHRSDGGVEPG